MDRPDARPDLEMTPAEAVTALDTMDADGGDQEWDHFNADAVLLSQVPSQVRDAYRRLREREGGFWYA